MRRIVCLCLLILSGGILSNCNPYGIAASVASDAALAASSERGIGGTLLDHKMFLSIQDRFLKKDTKLFTDVIVQVHEGRVLLTGSVDKQQSRIEAVRLVWTVDDVREVINEIMVRNDDSIIDAAQDKVIIQKLKAKLLFDKQIRLVNYSIESHNGTLYLIGIGRDAAEIQRVINHARDIAYVRKVVSYVRIRNST